MDALVKTAIESLVKKILPSLKQELSAALAQSSERPSAELQYLLTESRGLLDLLQTWCPQSTQASPKNTLSPAAEDLSDDEAMMLMADMGEAPKAPKSSGSDDDELSEDEAQALLMELETPAPKAKLAAAAAPAKAKAGPMENDEASRLLAEMDAPLPAKAGAMEDDETSRLLAEMDAPLPAKAKSMDDDEASRLLAEMDDPVPAPAAKASVAAPAAPPPVAAAVSAADEEELKEIPEWEANDFQSDPSMLNDFITNADELMQTVDEAILRLEQEPGNKSIIEEIFRAAHTLKGGSGMFGFKGIERVMHRMENLFDLIRKDKLVPNSDIIDTVFQGIDLLRTLLKAIKDGKPSGVLTAPVVYALSQAAKGKAMAKGSVKAPAAASEAALAPTAVRTEAKDSPEKKEDPGKKKEQSTIRVDLERLDVLVNLVGELVIDRTRFASIEEELRTNHPQIKLGSSFSETVQLFGRHMNEIQDIIMKVRMVPIGNAFNKFTRVVRDLARSLDKKIDLVINGEAAELDKTLVEQIGDPLIHLIRNSCDHGIEIPENRVKQGKDPTGRIFLSAFQEGNQIVIKIEDDGKGMDPQWIRRKAIEKGLVSEEEQMSNRDILNLIFEPGFSTAEKVTNISGRGVGMDVVKKQIQKLKGVIELDSAAGKGTTTTIRLPLTLAIVQSLLVRSRGETFAIPLGTVIESIRISPRDIQRIGDVEIYRLRDTVLPLVHLDEAMNLASQEGSVSDLLKQRQVSRRTRIKTDRLFVVVVGQADRPTGIVVDQLLNQQEMVIKSMGPLMKNIPCIAGGAVLGHGEVVLVLDIPELEAVSRGRGRGQAA